MPLEFATITFDLSDQLGVDFDPRRTKVWITTNVPGDTVIDTSGNKIRLGSGNVTLNADGTGSLSVWKAGQTGLNPLEWQTTIHVDYPDRNKPKGRDTRAFGPFTITASGDLAAMVAEQEIPPTYVSTVTAQLDAKVTEAESAATSAAAHRAAVENVVITDLGTTDGQTKTLIETDGTLTKVALTATYARTRPFAGEASEPSGQIAWTANPTLNFAPRSVGVDGRLYFTYLNKTLMRSSDPTLAVRTTGPDFTSKTPANILWATRTSAGYVVITNDSATDVANIWFCPEAAGFSANLDDWSLVQVIKAVTTISIAKPCVIAGTSWLVVGEYVTGVYPSGPRKLWLSKDGGQTWTSIRDSIATDTAVNSHWHCAVILPSGRVWASQGDGVNSWFGYTDDHENWLPAPLPTTHPLYDGASVYQQPTVLLDMDETLAATPDRGPFQSGVWAVDPDTGRTTEWHDLPSAEVTHTQYGTGSAQRGREAYISFPDQGSGSKKTYLLGTGDGGRTWHSVSTIDTTGGSLSGPIVGPDANGKVYMQPTSGSIPTYTTGIMIGTLPVWS